MASGPTTRVVQFEFSSPKTNFFVTINVGDSVRWFWRDTRRHNVVSGSNGVSDGKFSSGLALVNGTFTQVFNEPGSYPYYCAVHPTVMIGVITVVAPANIACAEFFADDVRAFSVHDVYLMSDAGLWNCAAWFKDNLRTSRVCLGHRTVFSVHMSD